MAKQFYDVTIERRGELFTASVWCTENDSVFTYTDSDDKFAVIDLFNRTVETYCTFDENEGAVLIDVDNLHSIKCK